MKTLKKDKKTINILTKLISKKKIGESIGSINNISKNINCSYYMTNKTINYFIKNDMLFKIDNKYYIKNNKIHKFDEYIISNKNDFSLTKSLIEASRLMKLKAKFDKTTSTVVYEDNDILTMVFILSNCKYEFNIDDVFNTFINPIKLEDVLNNNKKEKSYKIQLKIKEFEDIIFRNTNIKKRLFKRYSIRL